MRLRKQIPLIEKSEDKPLPQDVDDADQILDPKLFKSKDPKVDKAIKAEKEKAKKELEIGKPLPFTKQEKHSFGEWLQLASLKTIERDHEKLNKSDSTEEDIDYPIRERCT